MLLYTVLVVIVIIVIGIYIVGNIQDNMYRARYQELKYTAGRITDTVEISYAAGDASLPELFARVVTSLLTEGVNEENTLIYLLSPQGDELYSRSGTLTPADLNSRTIAAAVGGSESKELYVHNVSVDGAERLFGDYAAPVMRDGSIWYIVLLRQSMEDIQENMRRNTLTIAMASLIAIAISAVLAYFLASGISRPLERLTRRTQEMASGNLDVAEEVVENRRSADEIEELENNFGNMAGELKRMFSEASSEKNKLETIFHHMADGLVVFDQNENVVQMNPAARELIGEASSAETFRRIFPKESFDDLLHSREGNISERSMEFESTQVRAEFASYRNEEGEPEGLIVVLQDVTKQHRAEEMQREFVANVSHELRTPITTVKSYVETLLDGGIDDPDTRTGFLQVIDNESNRMTSLIVELLELSRIDSRQVQLAMVPLDLSRLLSDCVRRYQIYAANKRQILTLADPLPLIPVMCDRSRMEQAVSNIVMNAINYSPEEASITCWSSVDEERQEGILHIRDTGVGIPPKEQERIFERFYRVDKARSRSSGGTGLGLPIAKEMVEMHHGRIELDSVPGEGSTFRIILPLANAEEVENDARA